MNLSLLGSTGSIGKQTLSVVRSAKNIRITALASKKNIDVLTDEIREFHPEICCVYDEDKASELKTRLRDEIDAPRIVSGMAGLKECASYKNSDTVMVALSGLIAIEPTIEAIISGKNICQANKESIVGAGDIIMPLVKKSALRFIPVDSEHSAIYQCLKGEEKNEIDKIFLTCSGGPFRGYKLEELKNVTPLEALKHPSWKMGKKITIDCATLINKGLEIIEAHQLFDVPAENIIPIVQPGSIVHSMIQFKDGSVKAQLGPPDMRVAISYALMGEKRISYEWKKTLDFSLVSDIHFENPDSAVFKGLKLGIEACKKGGLLPAVFAAADEVAAGAFLHGQIRFTDIADFVEKAMKSYDNHPVTDIDSVIKAADWARKFVRKLYSI